MFQYIEALKKKIPDLPEYRNIHNLKVSSQARSAEFQIVC